MDKLNFHETKLKGSYIIEPNSFEDDRGKFSRIFCKDEFKNIFNEEFIQFNHSITYKKGTVRGFHFQYPPYSETKLVKCIKGSILDIIIDIRKDSDTFLQYHSEILSSKNMKMIFIPKGFAHGFQTLEDDTELLYFHSQFYTPDYEDGLNIKDKKLNIKFPLEISDISQRDKNHKFLDKNFQGLTV